VTFTLAFIGVLALLIGAYDYTRRARSRRDIASASDIQNHYGLIAENRPILHLDPAHVPIHLRHLVPLAEKWGIGDDIIRNDLINESSSTEKGELHAALYAPFESITDWLASFSARPLSPEAEAFMYMQTALDEMGYYILEEKRAQSPESSD